MMELLWDLLWALYWSIYLLLNSKVRHYLVPLGDGATREDNITCFIKAEPIEYVLSNLIISIKTSNLSIFIKILFI